MMNPIKFGSYHLDTPSSRYEFLKLAFKSVKKKKNQYNTVTDRWGPLVSRTHAPVTRNKGSILAIQNLAGGEITSDDDDTIVFLTTSRVGWW